MVNPGLSVNEEIKMYQQLLFSSVLVVSVFAAAAPAADGGAGAEVVMSGLAGPIGLEADTRARVWVSQMGSPPTSTPGSLSWFYIDQTELHPFITDYPYAINPVNGEAAGAHHATIDNEGNVIMAVGGPPIAPKWGVVIQYDSSPAVAEAGPYSYCETSPCDFPVTNVIEVAMFTVTNGGSNTNLYSVAQDPAGNIYTADAGGNTIVKYDAMTTELSVFAILPNITNPKGTEPPISEAVPTRIIAIDNDGAADSLAFVVVELTGVPFIPGNSRIWGLTNDGTASILVSGLTTLLDCTIDPTDNSLLVSSAGSYDFDAGIFSPGTGAIERVNLATGEVTMVRGGLWLPTGIEVIGGDIYFCTFYEGSIYRFDPCPADITGNGIVDDEVLAILLGAWGVCK